VDVKRPVFPAFSSREVTLGQMRKIGIHFIIYPRVIAACDLYCCLLLQCDALRTCRSGFPIATKRCCDQDVKVVPGAAFTKTTRDRRSAFKKEEYCCKLSVSVALNVRFTTNGMCAKNYTHIYVARTSKLEWLWRMIYIVACCHSVKLCALAARAFRLQQYQCCSSKVRFFIAGVS